MNTRKANLRKLRLPGGTTNKSRNGHQRNTTTISNYFSNEENSEDVSNRVEMTVYSAATPSPIIGLDNETPAAEETPSSSKENLVELANAVETTVYSETMPSPIEAEVENPEADKPERALRTKLSTFLPKENRLKAGKRSAHDFETPNKVVKRAPKTKSKATSKKQQNIKSAFFKHEELFSEVTAQHCLAENINPEEMQMAIALSRSEAEISMCMIEDDQDEANATEGKDGIRDKLKKFGFRVAESEDYNLTAFMPPKNKTKWANKFTALTLRNPKRQIDKVNQKIENLMSSQFISDDLLNVEDAVRYSLKNKALARFLPKDEHVIRSDISETATILDFYVLSLFEPSRTRVGHLLKDMRLIAGRDATPKKAKPIYKNYEVDVPFQSPAMKKSRFDEAISSSCPIPNRNLLEVFDTALAQPVLVRDSSFYKTDKEITSLSLNLIENETIIDAMRNASASSKDMTCETSNNISLTVPTEIQTAFSPVRSTSPDIFADSDTEIATDEGADIARKFNASKSSSSDHHITTYEIFSSDEVKTFSVTRKDSNTPLSPTSVIDLTQCGSDTNSQPTQNGVQPIEENGSNSDFLVTALTLSSNFQDDINDSRFSKSIDQSYHSNGQQSLEKSIQKKQGSISFGSSMSEEFDKCNSKNLIDLTQNGDEEEDDCILLSDDEVNYSILQDNKTEHIEENHLVENISIDHLLDRSKESECENHEFSFVDLVTGSQPLPTTQSDDFDKDLGRKSNTSLELEVDLDLSKRSDFGILEEQSPFKTPTKTPRKTPMSKSPKCRKTLPEYFITSPNTSARCSSTNSANGNSQLDLDLSKRSDFGIIDEQSPFKTPTKTPKKITRKTPTSASPKCRKTLSKSFISLATEPGNTLKRSLSTNTVNGNSPLDLDLSKRSDFGILDEQSPFKTPTKTPRKTPRKTPTSASPKCRKALSESFLSSPSERVTPVKRFSSVNKFKEFTKCDDDDENLSDLDEIDKLIYGSPSKRAYKKPAGLDQLLTGPINTKIDSPQKSEPDSPKEFVFNGRTYLVRTSNVAQMPDYETMDETALLNQLYKYGIRPLKRKQATKVLEYIYKQTHPCLVEPNEVPDQSKQSTYEDKNALNEDHLVEHPIDEASSVFKFNFKDCWGHLLVSNADIQMEIEDEQFIVPTNTSKKISTVLLPFHIAWHNLVKSNKLLHEAILHYEPIDLQEIFVFFKRLGYRYDPKELKYFFDSRSIIFRYDLNKTDPSAGANRHTRKRPHKSSQRSGKIKIS